MRTFGAVLLGCAALALAACATGSEELGDGAKAAGAGGEGGGSATTTTTTTSSSSGAGGGGGAGEGGGGQGGGGGGGEACDHGSPVCASAGTLPEVRGDEGNDFSSATGETSAFFHVYVSESVSDPFDYPQLSYTAQLVSPPGVDYDLYVYTGNDGGPNCQATPVKGVTSGSAKVVTDTWGDSPGSEDGTWITVEVRYVSGSACDAWSLTVFGHTDP